MSRRKRKKKSFLGWIISGTAKCISKRGTRKKARRKAIRERRRLRRRALKERRRRRRMACKKLLRKLRSR